MVGIGKIGSISVRLVDEELFLFVCERVPALEQIVGPRCQLGILQVSPQAVFDLRKSASRSAFQPIVEQMHIADLLLPLGSRIMWGMGAAGNKI